VLMRNKKKINIIIYFYLMMFLLVGNFAYAHQPDLSSLMIYEQNGKHLLIIKSSLTAFEGEIDYCFEKNAYKTPEDFQALVIKLFQKNCFLIINNDTIKCLNPRVILGHETTIFVELSNIPNNINSIYVKNTLFKDIPNNACELILSIKDLPQKQYILNKDNKQEVKLSLENNLWTIDDLSNPFYKTSNLIFLGVFALLVLIVAIIVILKKKNISLR